MITDWTDGYLTTPDGVKIHYTRTGDAAKPALVLCHGFSDNGMCWLPVARDLEDTFDVILPDARGHGLSDRVDLSGKVDAVHDLYGVIQVLGLEHPIIGGHSMGASTASAFEACHPGIARALILEDPAWFDKKPDPDPKEAPPPNPWYEWLGSLSRKTLEEVMQECRQVCPTWDEVEVRPWAESKKALDMNITRAESVSMDWREVVKKIHAPTLLLTAETEKGSLVTPEIAAFATAASPSIRPVHIPGAGHSIRRENYPVYMAEIKKFLSKFVK